MSDPVTNVEIEDVLSSIKRLVSAGEQAKTPAKPQESPDNQASDLPPRFVLTPAFRVTEPEDVVESTEVEADEMSETEIVFADGRDEQIEPAGFEEEHPSARDTLEATIAELEAAVVDQPDEWEPDGSEVTSVPTWETVSYPPLDEVEDAVSVEETAPEDMHAEDMHAEGIHAEEQLPEAVPEDRVAFSATTDEQDALDALDAILSSGPFISEDAVYTPDDLMPVPEEEDRFADAENVEALTFNRSQPIPTADDPAEDYGDELLPDPEPVGEDEDLDTYMYGNGQGINEEVLRQVVMDVVREELQGNLGERITRNVRKMVRREINRALDMQNFD